jgi:two-component system cell cycle response regulator
MSAGLIEPGTADSPQRRGDLVNPMSAYRSEKTKVPSLTAKSRVELIDRVKSTTKLEALLDLFGSEIEKLGLVDGYLLNLRDSEAAHLISLKVHFTPEFHFLDETYYRYKVPLSGSALNVSARAFHSRGIVQCDLVSGTKKEKQLLNLWKLNEIAAIAILDDDDFSQLPIGTILLLKQEGHLDDHVFNVLEQLITIFYRPLRNALEHSFIEEHRDRFETGTAEQLRLMQFAVKMASAPSADSTYEPFASEVFRRYAFEGAGFFLLENDLLVNRKVIAANPQHQAIATAWQNYLRDKPYLPEPTDGGVSHTYVRNMPLLFHDVQTIIHLPMSEKDRETLAIFKTPRTLLINPVHFRDKAIGVAVFYSVTGLVEVGESDLQMISTLCELLGASVTRAG